MRPPRTGLSRLWRYTEGRRGRLSFVLALAAISAAAPVAGWHVVGDAIDNGIRAGDDARLVRDVVAYVAIGVVAWLLGTVTWLMLAGIGQRMVLELRRDLFEHLTSLSLRYFSSRRRAGSSRASRVTSTPSRTCSTRGSRRSSSTR